MNKLTEKLVIRLIKQGYKKIIINEEICSVHIRNCGVVCYPKKDLISLTNTLRSLKLMYGAANQLKDCDQSQYKGLLTSGTYIFQ